MNLNMLNIMKYENVKNKVFIDIQCIFYILFIIYYRGEQYLYSLFMIFFK